MVDAFYTSGQISELLEIPSSTLRRYVKTFAHHLSDDATKPRARRFNEQDTRILNNARMLLAGGMSYDAVDRRLSLVDDSPVESKALVTQADVEKWAAEVTVTFEDLRTEIDDLKAEVEYLKRPWWKKIRGG